MAVSFLFFLCGSRDKASSRVRGYWIAEELAESGIKCSMESRQTKWSFLTFALRIFFYDVIVFQKTYSRWHCLLLRQAKLLGRKTILDLDDAPSRNNNPSTLRNVEFMMRNASFVTVGSTALYDYASQYSRKVHLIPSSIRLEQYNPANKERGLIQPVCLGWIGNGKHYKKDLIDILREPLSKIAQKQPVRFKLIGACDQPELYTAFKGIPGLELDFIDQINWSNPEAVSESLVDVDIGLYPLLPNEFNQYKCGFKALEYMAMGIPVVSSDVAENREIIEDGINGFIACNDAKWELYLSMLSNDAGMRKMMGSAGRVRVEERYSVKRATDLLQRLFNK